MALSGSAASRSSYRRRVEGTSAVRPTAAEGSAGQPRCRWRRHAYAAATRAQPLRRSPPCCSPPDAADPLALMPPRGATGNDGWPDPENPPAASSRQAVSVPHSAAVIWPSATAAGRGPTPAACPSGSGSGCRPRRPGSSSRSASPASASSTRCGTAPSSATPSRTSSGPGTRTLPPTRPPSCPTCSPLRPRTSSGRSPTASTAPAPRLPGSSPRTPSTACSGEASAPRALGNPADLPLVGRGDGGTQDVREYGSLPQQQLDGCHSSLPPTQSASPPLAARKPAKMSLGEAGAATEGLRVFSLICKLAGCLQRMLLLVVPVAVACCFFSSLVGKGQCIIKAQAAVLFNRGHNIFPQYGDTTYSRITYCRTIAMLPKTFACQSCCNVSNTGSKAV